MNKYQIRLQDRIQKNLLRQLPNFDWKTDFYSNDYLGFARNKQLIERIKIESSQYCTKQIGATGSRLLSGNNEYVEKVETSIADFHQMPAALLFNSGFTANVGLLSCIAGKEDTLIMDELIHASLIDGARLSKAKSIRFKHNDLEDLAQKLATIEGSKIVVVESLYSMDGDICPLKEVVDLCSMYQAQLIVDEAHGIGVFGERGEGLVGQLGLGNAVMATVVTYGKAMGCHGAAILGKQWLKDYLINFSRSFIFTTGPSMHQLAALRCSYECLSKAHQERQQLQAIIQYFNTQKTKSPFDWMPSDSQIQAVVIPGNEAVMEAANQLQANGIAAMGIRYPSVARGAERIRICLHAFNTKQEIDFLMAQLVLIAEKQLEKV